MLTLSEFIALIPIDGLPDEERKAVDDAWHTLFKLLPPDAQSELLEMGTFHFTCDETLCANRKPNGNCACGSYSLMNDPASVCPEFDVKIQCHK